MAEMARTPDYLRITASNARRLRNLETGVHPTGSDLDYYDTYLPTEISITNSKFNEASTGIQDYPPKWQRRVGVAMLTGGVEPTGSTDWAGCDDDEVIGRLPAEARPMVDYTAIVPVEAAPFWTRISIDTDGYITVFKPAGIVSENAWVRFEGTNWLVN